METMNFYIAHYGYFGIYFLLLLGIVGIPVPDETLIALTGFMIYRGELSLIPSFFSAWAGSISGITISYFIGKGFGRFVLQKYGRYIHLTPENLEKAHSWFNRFGHWALFLGYFIPGVRHITAIFAGMSRLEYPEFALYTYAGGGVWVAAFLSIGFFFGEKWHSIIESVHRHLVISAIVLAFLLLAVYYIRKKLLSAPGSGK